MSLNAIFLNLHYFRIRCQGKASVTEIERCSWHLMRTQGSLLRPVTETKAAEARSLNGLLYHDLIQFLWGLPLGRAPHGFFLCGTKLIYSVSSKIPLVGLQSGVDSSRRYSGQA